MSTLISNHFQQPMLVESSQHLDTISSLFPVTPSSPTDHKVSKKIVDRNEQIIDIVNQTLKEFIDGDVSRIVDSFKNKLIVLTTKHCLGFTKLGTPCQKMDPFIGEDGFCHQHKDGKSGILKTSNDFK